MYGSTLAGGTEPSPAKQQRGLQRACAIQVRIDAHIAQVASESLHPTSDHDQGARDQTMGASAPAKQIPLRGSLPFGGSTTRASSP